MYCAESMVYHMGGATLHESSPRKTFLNFRNNMIIMAKNLPKREFLGKIFIRLVLDGVAAIKFLLEGQGAHTWQVLRAHFSFYGRFFGILKARRVAPNTPPMKTIPGAFKGTTVWQYFIKKHRKFSELPQQLFTRKS